MKESHRALVHSMFAAEDSLDRQAIKVREAREKLTKEEDSLRKCEDKLQNIRDEIRMEGIALP